MDEVVTDDQRAVLEQTAKFAAKECPIARLRDGIHREPDFRTRYWRQGAELGWFFSMLVAESLGGGKRIGQRRGRCHADCRQTGAALQPGPFVATNVTAYALAAAGSDEQKERLIPALLSGEASAVWAATGSCGGAPDAGGVWATPDAVGLRAAGTQIAGPGHRVGVMDARHGSIGGRPPFSS